MSNQDKIKLLASFILFGLSILFFSLGVQKYQVLTSSQADEGDVEELDFSKEEGHGTLNQKFGIILSDIESTTTVNEIDGNLRDNNVFIKIPNVSVDTISHANFAKLSQNGFKWYFGFTDYETIDAVLTAYYASYQNEVVIELTNYDSFNATEVNSLLTKYPNAKFHAAQFAFWPRADIKELFEALPPPALNAASFYTFVDNPTAPVKDDVKTMFDTFYDASTDTGGSSGIEINYPANSALSLSDIRTNPDGNKTQEEARRFGIISSAIVTSIQSQGGNDNAPIRYIIAGDYATMSQTEKLMLTGYAVLINEKPEILWPRAESVHGDAMNEVFPLVGVIGYDPEIGNGSYGGFITNIESEPITVKLPDEVANITEIYSNTRGLGDYMNDDNEILLQGYETVGLFQPSASGGTGPTTTPTVTTSIPYPTFPPIPTQAKGSLICDGGPDPYDSSTIILYNDTGETIEDLTSYVHRCTYEPGKITKGFYKCETSASCDPNDENCDPGVWDQDAGEDFSLAPGEQKVIQMVVNPCEIAQLDVQNADTHEGDSLLECTNIRSQHTVDVGKRWPGGISFAIDDNATGYNAETGECIPPPTNTPTPTTPPVETPTNTPTTPPNETPTNTPTLPPDTPTPTVTNTPSPSPTPTVTPAPTNTIIPTNTPLPTHTPLPRQNTPTPITQIAVENQPPGITPWAIIGLPIALVLIGLFL